MPAPGPGPPPQDTPAPKADAPVRPPQAVAQALTNVETSTGWTRLLHFSDPRPPHEVQSALERELMALFNAGMVGSRLCLNATAHVHGARYDFELSYVAALKSTNHFSLLTTASWAGCDAKNVDYYRKSSDCWFLLWTRDLMSANPPAVEENLSDAYGKSCQAALQAQHAFHSVTSVQHAIIDGLKRGGRFGTSHKEGGTNIFWQAGKFVRSDYGDYPGGQKFTDEGEFLKMLWNFSQFEVTRHAGKQGLPELDAWKLILRSMSPVAPPHPENMRGGGVAGGSSALTGMVAATPKLGVSAGWPLHSSPLAIGFMIGVLLLLGLGMAAWQFVSIKSTGTPLGQALGTPTHIFHLISTTERFLPKLHRPPGKDRFRIDLLVVPIADPSHPETFTLLRQQQSNALAPMTRILGVEGDVVWIQALDTFAVNLRTHRVAREEDLRKANPELGNFLQSARGHFDGRFFAVSPDWSRAYNFSPATLKATACPPPPRSSLVEEQLNARPERSLCSGGLISSNGWLAVATPDHASSNFKPGFSLPRDFNAGDKDPQRQLFHGSADTSESRPRYAGWERLGELECRAANFLRTRPGGSILQSDNPDSVFLLHRMGTEAFAPYSLTRLATDGRPLWNAESSIGQLSQILPGSDTIALIGERPPVPDQVPEPILVLIESASGRTQIVSLWR